MEQQDRLRLRKNRVEIVKDVDTISVLDHLYSNEIIEDEEIEIIESKQTRRERVQTLLNILPTRGPNAYSVFRDSLKDKYDWIVECLDNTDVSTAEPPLACGVPYTELTHSVFKLIADTPEVLLNWKGFGRDLGVDDTELVELEHANSRSIKEQCYQMLASWRNKHGSDANIEKLKETLRYNGFTHVADRLEGKIP